MAGRNSLSRFDDVSALPWRGFSLTHGMKFEPPTFLHLTATILKVTFMLYTKIITKIIKLLLLSLMLLLLSILVS